MGITVHFLGIQIVALIFYVFLFCCFIGQIKEKSVIQLKKYLLASIIWVLGSLLMRLQIFPGMKWWYHVSLIGLFLMMGAMFDMATTILGRFPKGISSAYYIILLILEAVNIVTEKILAPPEIVMINGGMRFQYSVKAGLLIGVIPVAAFLVYFFKLLAATWKERREDFKNIRLLVWSVIIILLGNVLVLLPGVNVPLDVATGIIAAMLLVVMIYQRRLFRLSEKMLVGIICMSSLVFAYCPIVFMLFDSRTMVQNLEEKEAVRFVTIFLGISGLWMLMIFAFSSFLISHYTNRREHEIQSRVGGFQKKISSSLNMEYLCRELLETVQELTQAEGVIIDLYDATQVGGYTKGIGSFWNKSVERNSTPEFLDFVLKQEECFFAKEGIKLGQFIKAKGMKQWLDDGGFSGIGCLENDSELLGYIFISEDEGQIITREQEQQISVVCFSAASALRNAILYQKLYEESITDNLTGLFNRKYIYEQIAEHEKQQLEMGVLHLDIDNFKLYNELYGFKEGDKLLQWCREIFESVLPEGSVLCRQAADEFLILLKETDADTIMEYGKRIMETLSDETRRSEKYVHYVTMSGGVSSYPKIAAHASEAIHQAEQATSQAKAFGRNLICIYNKNMEERERSAYEDVAPTIYALTAAIDAKDSYTFVHVQKVSEYAVALAKAIGYSNENIEIIRQAALLHDIGKISVPEHILKKMGKLTDEEYEIIKKHVVNSIDIIKFLPGMDYVIPAVIGHHERYDAMGYPRGIGGDALPESARILAIADSFDAMTSKRSYKDAYSVEFAIKELERCKGSQFDPKLVDTFVELLKNEEVKIS